MNNKEKKVFSARNLVYFSILTALIVVLQIWGGNLRIGAICLNLTLVPLVLGGMILGVWYGMALGLVVGLVTFILVVTGVDAWTAPLFAEQPFVIAFVCILKGVLSGLGSALIYKAISKKNELVSSFVASASAPIINTGIFVLGMLCIIDTLKVYSPDVYNYLFLTVVGVNFLVELGLNLILAPAISRVVRVIEKRKG